MNILCNFVMFFYKNPDMNIFLPVSDFETKEEIKDVVFEYIEFIITDKEYIFKMCWI